MSTGGGFRQFLYVLGGNGNPLEEGSGEKPATTKMLIPVGLITN